MNIRSWVQIFPLFVHDRIRVHSIFLFANNTHWLTGMNRTINRSRKLLFTNNSRLHESINICRLAVAISSAIGFCGNSAPSEFQLFKLIICSTFRAFLKRKMESKNRNNASTGKNNENKIPLTLDQINSDRVTQVLECGV